MLDYNVARSMCISPIMSALNSNGISFDEASFLSGIKKERLLEIGMGIGHEANIEEAARLASLVGMELSIVPESAGIHAFTEIAVHRTAKADMIGYARRVVEMTDKVSDLCIDLRLATELPTGVFERAYGVEEGFMAHLADVTRSASTNLQDIFKYLTAFGATLASFPRKSEYVNYYRAVASVEREPAAPAASLGLRVA